MTKRIDWDLILSKFNNSSLSVKEFPLSQGISSSGLYKKLRECDVDNAFVEVSNIPNHNKIKVIINGNSLEYPCCISIFPKTYAKDMFKTRLKTICITVFTIYF